MKEATFFVIREKCSFAGPLDKTHRVKAVVGLQHQPKCSLNTTGLHRKIDLNFMKSETHRNIASRRNNEDKKQVC